MLPRHARCALSRLCCNGHSFLCSSYLTRISGIENPSCSACEHPSQDTSHLVLHCPATDSLRRWLFSDSLFLYDLYFRPWTFARLPGLHGRHALILGRSRVATTTTCVVSAMEKSDLLNKDFYPELGVIVINLERKRHFPSARLFFLPGGC